MRPSSVASSTSLNFGPLIQQQQIGTKPMVVGPSPNPHVPPPEPDKLMTYEQAMIYAHPALKDACKFCYFTIKRKSFSRFLFSTFSSST